RRAARGARQRNRCRAAIVDARRSVVGARVAVDVEAVGGDVAAVRVRDLLTAAGEARLVGADVGVVGAGRDRGAGLAVGDRRRRTAALRGARVRRARIAVVAHDRGERAGVVRVADVARAGVVVVARRAGAAAGGVGRVRAQPGGRVAAVGRAEVA